MGYLNLFMAGMCWHCQTKCPLSFIVFIQTIKLTTSVNLPFQNFMKVCVAVYIACICWLIWSLFANSQRPPRHSWWTMFKFFNNSHQGTPLHLAAEAGHMDIVRYLVEKGADINIKDDIFKVSEREYTANCKLILLVTLSKHLCYFNHILGVSVGCLLCMWYITNFKRGYQSHSELACSWEASPFVK